MNNLDTKLTVILFSYTDRVAWKRSMIVDYEEKNVLSKQENKQKEIRQDSHSSDDDSQNSKKPASLNEIQDLYSALQDLVKTNVTKTPPSSKNSPKTTHSPSIESTPPNNFGRNNSEILLDDKHIKLVKQKRGLSTGPLDTVSHIIRKSPFPTRKLSSEITVVESLELEQDRKIVKKTSRSSSAVGGKLKKDIKLFRNSSGYERKQENKKRKPNLFTRLRSKSQSWMIDDNDENNDSHKRRPTLIDLEINKKFGSDIHHTCPPLRRNQTDNEINKDISNVCTDDVKDIDQLVAALNLEYNDKAFNNETPQSHVTAKSPQSELNKLESWFEKAAAEAVMYHSQFSIDGEEENDAKYSPGEYSGKLNGDGHRHRRKEGPRRPSTIRRGQSSPRSKEFRKECKIENDFENFELNRTNSLCKAQALSTPNLHDYNILNNTDITVSSHREKKLEFTENNLKEGSVEESKKTRKISVDDGLIRFPKTPLFYIPTDENRNQNNKLMIDEGNSESKKHKCFETEVFYIEPKHSSNRNSPRMRDNARHESDSVTQTKQNNADLEELNKLRPKSMFAQNYFETHFLYDVKSLWTSTGDSPDNVRNSLTLDTGIQTDDNQNFCQAKITNNTHTLCNVNPMIMQEKSLWEKFRHDHKNTTRKCFYSECVINISSSNRRIILSTPVAW